MYKKMGFVVWMCYFWMYKRVSDSVCAYHLHYIVMAYLFLRRKKIIKAIQISYSKLCGCSFVLFFFYFCGSYKAYFRHSTKLFFIIPFHLTVFVFCWFEHQSFLIVSCPVRCRNPLFRFNTQHLEMLLTSEQTNEWRVHMWPLGSPLLYKPRHDISIWPFWLLEFSLMYCNPLPSPVMRKLNLSLSFFSCYLFAF